MLKLLNIIQKLNPCTIGFILGSVLGPLLFTIYVGDIFERVTHGKAIIFVDAQTCAYFIRINLNCDVEARINRDISIIPNFVKTWLIEPTLDNSYIILIGLNLSLYLWSQIIFFIRWSWNRQSSSIVPSRTGLTLHNFKTNEIKLSLLLSLVRPYLEIYPFLDKSQRQVDRNK